MTRGCDNHDLISHSWIIKLYISLVTIQSCINSKSRIWSRKIKKISTSPILWSFTLSSPSNRAKRSMCRQLKHSHFHLSLHLMPNNIGRVNWATWSLQKHMRNLIIACIMIQELGVHNTMLAKLLISGKMYKCHQSRTFIMPGTEKRFNSFTCHTELSNTFYSCMIKPF